MTLPTPQRSEAGKYVVILCDTIFVQAECRVDGS